MARKVARWPTFTWAMASVGRSARTSSLRLSTTSKATWPGFSISPGCTARRATCPAKGATRRAFFRRSRAIPRLLSAAWAAARVAL